MKIATSFRSSRVQPARSYSRDVIVCRGPLRFMLLYYTFLPNTVAGRSGKAGQCMLGFKPTALEAFQIERMGGVPACLPACACQLKYDLHIAARSDRSIPIVQEAEFI